MSKPTDRWLPLHTGDYLRDTKRLNAEQHGCYLLLLMESWIHGPLPNDLKNLSQICGMSRTRFERAVAPLVMPYFMLDDQGRLIQKRLEIERKKASKNVAQKADAARAKYLKFLSQESNDINDDVPAVADEPQVREGDSAPNSAHVPLPLPLTLPESSIQGGAAGKADLFGQAPAPPPKPRDASSTLFGPEGMGAMAFFLAKDPVADAAAVRSAIGKLRRDAGDDDAILRVLLEQGQNPARAGKGFGWIVGCLKREAGPARLAVDNTKPTPKTDDEAIEFWCKSVPGVDLVPEGSPQWRWGKWQNRDGILDYWARAVLDAAGLPAIGRSRREMDLILDWMARGHDADNVVRAIENAAKQAHEAIFSLGYFENTINRLRPAA